MPDPRLIVVLFCYVIIMLIQYILIDCNIVRHPYTYQRTTHLILAIFTLKRYHPIWFTFSTTSTPTTPNDREIPLSHSTSMTSVPPPALPHPVYQTKHTVTTSQLLLPLLIYDDTFTWSNSTMQNHTQNSLYYRLAKR